MAVDVYAATLKSTSSEPQSATVVLEGSDFDLDALTYNVVSPPSDGALSDPNNSDAAVAMGVIAGRTLIYTPADDFTGTDTFTYKVNDGVSDSAVRIATISVFDAVRTEAKQIGADIDGEAAGDYSGVSVALSSNGQTLAVGATLNDGNGHRAGHVRVYARSGSAWSQLGDDIDGEVAEDFFGGSLALSSDGQTLAAGASLNDGNGDRAGHVRVYAWSGLAWSQLGDDIDGEAAEDLFGRSLALSSDGQTLAAGAYNNDGNGDRAGHVRVYAWSGSTWSQLGDDIDGEAAGDNFGYAVALSSDGQTLAVGATGGSSTDANNAGQVRVYAWSGSAWSKMGDDIEGEAADDKFGSAVALSSDGQTLAVGAYLNDGTGYDAGHVRAYAWSGSAWIQLGDDIDSEAAGDNFGYVVALSSDGQTLAVGAGSNDGNGAYAGHVRVYAWSGSAWSQLGDDIDGEAGGDQSRAVALSSDGQTLAVGAYLNDGNGSQAGHVRVFNLSSSAPLISGTPSYYVTSGAVYDFIPSASDADYDTLVFSVTKRPSWASFSTTTGAITGTPAASDAGTTTDIVITVSDGTFTADLSSFDITVLLDTDGDGDPDSCDPECQSAGYTEDTDDDNDGVTDDEDAFPLDASETADADGDGVGNTQDTDDDNDGVTDDEDAFPLDASESADTDGDGVGDNADLCPQANCEPRGIKIDRTDYEEGSITLDVSVTDDGGELITGYRADCTDGTITISASSTISRIIVTGLLSDVAYQCNVSAINANGESDPSLPSDPIIPEAIADGLPIWLLYQATQ